MTHVRVYKAQAVGDEEVPGLLIEAIDPMPSGGPLHAIRAMHDSAAENIVAALWASLPQGTLDRVAAQVMARIAGDLVIRQFG